MKFSQFGNLLACQDGRRIIILNFFTGVLNENYVFNYHRANVKSIQWLEDDLGFVSTDNDFTIIVW